MNHLTTESVLIFQFMWLAIVTLSRRTPVPAVSVNFTFSLVKIVEFLDSLFCLYFSIRSISSVMQYCFVLL